MELNDLFNISDEQIAMLERNASDIQKKGNQSDDTVSYGCICCGKGLCIMGIAAD